MKGMGDRVEPRPRPAPPLPEYIEMVKEWKPKSLRDWPSCQAVLSKNGQATAKAEKKACNIVLNDGQTHSAPKSLEFEGKSIHLFL